MLFEQIINCIDFLNCLKVVFVEVVLNETFEKFIGSLAWIDFFIFLFKQIKIQHLLLVKIYYIKYLTLM